MTWRPVFLRPLSSPSRLFLLILCLLLLSLSSPLLARPSLICLRVFLSRCEWVFLALLGWRIFSSGAVLRLIGRGGFGSFLFPFCSVASCDQLCSSFSGRNWTNWIARTAVKTSVVDLAGNSIPFISFCCHQDVLCYGPTNEGICLRVFLFFHLV